MNLLIVSALAIISLSQINAFNIPKSVTSISQNRNDGIFTSSSSVTSASKTSTSTTSLHMIKRKRGAASSKKADLEKTINAIMDHIENDEEREEARRIRKVLRDEKLAEERAQRLTLPQLIDNGENQIMLRRRSETKNNAVGTGADAGEMEMYADSSTSSSGNENGLDRLLSKLTSLFPVFVLSAAIAGIKKPSALMWVNNGQLIPLMLSAVMMAMGMTLRTQDFTRILTKQNNSNDDGETSIVAIPAGISCQYIIMPLAAFLIGSTTLLPHNPAAFLGLVLVGCSPGGTASNLVALIAKADVALSVILTSVSTIMASLLTPLLVKTLVGSAVSISGWTLGKATAQVVLLPVVLGMLIREKIPKLADVVSRYASFAGVVLVSLLCGGVVAQNAAMAVGNSSKLLWQIIGSVLGLHTIGFGVGYLASKKIFGLPERVSRTISIETGMQNSALAVVLARSVLSADPATASLVGTACLPGALSATAHSCLGSALAVFWRWVDKRRGRATQ